MVIKKKRLMKLILSVAFLICMSHSYLKTYNWILDERYRILDS